MTLSALPCPWGWLQASSGAGEMSGVLLGRLYGTQVGGSPWDALLLPGAVGQGAAATAQQPLCTALADPF